MSVLIRPYSPSDRAAVRHICCETGFSGDPVDPLFCDRDAFADFLTRYYTDWEPESTLIVEDDGQVTGYLTACIRYRYFKAVQLYLFTCVIIPKIAFRLLTGRYNAQSRAFLKWICLKGNRETPAAPKRSAHFHFNLLKDYRRAGIGLRLVVRLKEILRSRGVKRVYGQIQTSDGRRTERVFQHYGFEFYDKCKVTKFQDFHDNTIYCSTLVYDFEKETESMSEDSALHKFPAKASKKNYD